MKECLGCSEAISNIYASILNDILSTNCYENIAANIKKMSSADDVVIYSYGKFFENYRKITSTNEKKAYGDYFEKIPEGENVFKIMSTTNYPTGFVWIDINNKLTVAQSKFIEACCLILASEFEKYWVKRMLKKITEPVDIALAKDDFYNEINKLSCIATNMQYSAIRKYNIHTKTLECKSFWSSKDGFYDISNSKFDFNADSELFSIFYDVMHKNESNGNIYNNELYRKILSKEIGIDNISTFLIYPLSVGGNNFGTISFAIDKEINFSSMWRYGFRCIANNVCAALGHYEKSKEVAELRSSKFAEFNKIMNFDLIQGLRHSAGNDLHVLYLVLNEMDRILSSQNIGKKDIDNLKEELLEAESCRAKAAKAIDHQKNVSIYDPSINKYNREEFDLLEAINEAQQLVQYRLDRENSRIRVVKNNVPQKLIVFGDKLSVSYAFLNLFLNSIEAFPPTTKGGGGKRIIISVDSSGSKHKITYADNAGGFKPNYTMGITNIQDIFLPGKTTKKSGTGWGLTFVRDVFGRIHKNSSINAISDNVGITFIIEFPKCS